MTCEMVNIHLECKATKAKTKLKQLLPKAKGRIRIHLQLGDILQC